MQEEITVDEAVELGAIDSEFYSRHFFPKTCRQSSPEFHTEVWGTMEALANRYVGIKIFRDGAKTTLLRLFVSKRIAYGISRTILFVGKSENAAMKSIDWLRRAVSFNKLWSTTFGLEKGTQWSGSEIDIHSTVGDFSVRVIAIGITGATRGINIDDYRPDLIIVDDPCDEENTNTPEARLKISELFFGSLYQSLAPATDQPEAMMVLLQTPLDGEDLIEQVLKDKHWATLAFSCFNDEGQSRWESRYPTQTLIDEKQSFVDRNQLSLWLREKEVTIVSDELSYFKGEWIQYWDVMPEGGVNIISIDPTPPPKDVSTVKRVSRLDDFVIMVLKFHKQKIYVCEYYCAKSPLPGEWMNKYFEFLFVYRPLKTAVETTLFQRMVKWALEQEMSKRQCWNMLAPVEDKRKKETRITQELSGPLSNRVIYCHRNHTKLVEQIITYPWVSHDDVIDALAIGVAAKGAGYDQLGDGEWIDGDYKDVSNDTDWRGAP